MPTQENIQTAVLHFAPEALEPAIVDWAGCDVYIIDADSETIIGKGDICARHEGIVTIRLAPDFPKDFFDGGMMNIATVAGIKYKERDGLPRIFLGYEEQQEARYKNTKVVSRIPFDMKLKAQKEQQKISAAILNSTEAGCSYNIGEINRIASEAVGGIAGGTVFAKAVGEVLSKGFFQLNYLSDTNEAEFRRLG